MIKTKKTQKRERTYAFIDSQNLNLGTSKSIYRGNKIIYRGWKLDFRKFRIYLKHKFFVEKALLFIGYLKNNELLYSSLKKSGYELIFKPTVISKDGKSKGNIDAELVLYSCRIEYENFDNAVIVSGDGDFLCLHKFLQEENKLKSIIIPNSKSESSLLKGFSQYKTYIQYEKDKLRYKKGGRTHIVT